MTSIELLEGPKCIRRLVRLTCKGEMMDSILVVGDSLEWAKA